MKQTKSTKIVDGKKKQVQASSTNEANKAASVSPLVVDANTIHAQEISVLSNIAEANQIISIIKHLVNKALDTTLRISALNSLRFVHLV